MIETLLILLLLSISSAMLMSSFGDRRRGNRTRGFAIRFLLGAASATAPIALMFISIMAGFAWPISISAVILTAVIVLILARRLKGRADSSTLSNRRGEKRVGRAAMELGGIIRPSLSRIGALGLVIPVLAFALVYCGEKYRISLEIISPEQSQPWKEGLTATV